MAGYRSESHLKNLGTLETVSSQLGHDLARSLQRLTPCCEWALCVAIRRENGLGMFAAERHVEMRDRAG